MKIDNRDLWSLSDDELADFRLNTIGFVFQDYHLFPRLTTAENVASCGSNERRQSMRTKRLWQTIGRPFLEHLPRLRTRWMRCSMTPKLSMRNRRHSNSAAEALHLIQANYQAATVNYLQLLIADYQYQQAKLGYIQAMGQRLQDTAALFVALGGGWWSAPESTMGNSSAENAGSSLVPQADSQRR